ncbi:MAG: CHAP domain-containing protein [Byssovorax sp.]
MTHQSAWRTLSLLAASAALMITATVASGCIASDVSDEAADEASNEAQLSAEEVGTAEDELLACASATNCDNCVYYARCRKPSLPYGLTSYNDKVGIINTQTASAGAVAIINTGSYYGHVAYVTSVSGSTINIAEGNWPSGSCGTRSGTKTGLKIAGFYK